MLRAEMVEMETRTAEIDIRDKKPGRIRNAQTYSGRRKPLRAVLGKKLEMVTPGM